MPTQDQSAGYPQQTLLLAYLCVKDAATLAEQVHILDRFDLSDAQIAVVCNAAIGSVRNARLERKKKPAKQAGKNKTQ
jgi:hypothetical protein